MPQRLQFRSSPSWAVVELFVKVQINRQLYATDLGIPNISFITRERLTRIWASQLPDNPRETPFTVFCRNADCPKLTFPDFCQNLVQLTSALLYVGWNRIASKQRDCSIRWNRHNQPQISVPDVVLRWVDLCDESLPLGEDQIRLLFNLDDNGLIAFRDCQHQFRPVILKAWTHKPTRYPLGTRLPFVSITSEATGGRKGFYGEVDKVRIVEGHLEWAHPEEHPTKLLTANQVYACKTFKVEDSFSAEHHKLRTIGENSIHHDHIMMHITAFVVGPHFKILFPWAWADLNQFLTMDCTKYPSWLSRNALTPYNLLREAQHLGEALAFLHESLSSWELGNRPLFHMDFKSDNILIISPSESKVGDHPLGLFMISDFGLSDFGASSPGTDARVRTVGDVVHSMNMGSRLIRQDGPFQAPEVEKPSPGRIDHAKADVWSLGCVIAELLAFSALGPQGVALLRKKLQRRDQDPDGNSRSGYFYRFIDARTAQLFPALNDFMREPCISDDAANIWYDEMWSFTTAKALSTDPHQRQTARRFCEELRKFVQLSPTPKTCLFRHEELSGQIISPVSNNTEQRLFLSVPTSQAERMVTVQESQRSSSSPPPPLSVPRSELGAMPRPRRGNDGSPRATGQPPLLNTRVLASRARSDAPSTPRQSGSISTLDTPSLQHSSTFPTPRTDPTESMEFSEQLKGYKTDHLFVALSPDGTSILFSDGRQISYSVLPDDFTTPILKNENLPYGTQVGRDSIQLTSLSLVVKRDNKHATIHSTTGIEGSIGTSPRSLSHLTGVREIRSICISSTQCLAFEFTDTIEVFDASGQSALEHAKHKHDLIEDLSFDQTAGYLFAISSNRYWVWQFRAGDSSGFVPVQTQDTSLKGCTSGFQRRKILTIKGSRNFLIQDAHPKDGTINVVLVDDLGPRKLTLKSPDGSIMSTLCLTLDDREVFAVLHPHVKKRQPQYTFQRWQLTVDPNIAIKRTPLAENFPQISIKKSTFSTPGRLSIASLQVDRQNFALIAQNDGRVHRTPLEP